MISRLAAVASFAIACALAPLPAFAAAGDPVPVPKLAARVTDQTGSLTAPERDALEAKLRAFEEARGSQVAVLMVPSIGTETIEEFAGRVTDEWKLGRKGVDDGVLFVVAKQERKIRIHTGRGVQGTLTDALSRRIVADIVAPRFRTGDFAGGMQAGVDAIMKAIEGEQLPLPEARSAPGPKVDTMSSFGDFLVFGFFLVPVVAMVLRGMFGRFFGSGITAGLTGAAAWMFFGSIAFGLVAALLAFLFTLFTGGGGGIAPGARRGGWGGGYVPGGWSSGGGGFGGGGGGFSGGGGGFDGGGASGDF
ncbi:MAG TPA: TPM domain-containing protein [Usitatibacter sp.]|nr:TPM domain-containing protein [Usitatibacter sp.]